MSSSKTMRNGQPNRYWIFRNLVSTAQLTIVVILLSALSWWLLTDNNGLDLVNGYLRFSRDISAWGQDMRLPWE